MRALMDTLLQERRARAAAPGRLRDEVVLIGSGPHVHVRGGADLTYPYMAHSEYVWLAGHESPDSVLAFDPREGWTDFVPP